MGPANCLGHGVENLRVGEVLALEFLGSIGVPAAPCHGSRQGRVSPAQNVNKLWPGWRCRLLLFDVLGRVGVPSQVFDRLLFTQVAQ